MLFLNREKPNQRFIDIYINGAPPFTEGRDAAPSCVRGAGHSDQRSRILVSAGYGTKFCKGGPSTRQEVWRARDTEIFNQIENLGKFRGGNI